MTHIVGDGLTKVQTAGQRVRNGAVAAASELRGEPTAARRRADSVGSPESAALHSRLIELVSSLAGALAAFVVSRLVRARLRGQEK
jgi:hypothetical protein